MSGRALNRQDYESAIPIHCRSDLLRPLQFAERWLLANVINTTVRALIGRSQRNGRSYIFHIAARRMPCSQGAGKNDVAAPVGNALHYGIKTMQRIAGSVDHRKAQNGSRKF